MRSALWPAPGPRTSVAGVTALALLLGLSAGMAGPTDGAVPAQAVESVSSRPTAASNDSAEIIWGVQPSTSKGPDGRDGYDLTVDPGTTVTDWVAITNHSDRAATFRVYAADATTDYETGAFTLIGAERASSGLGAWISVDGRESSCPATGDQKESDCAANLGRRVRIPAGGRADLPVRMTIPADATPGDHAAGIVASFESTSGSVDGTGVQREDRVGTRVYLRVKGDLQPSVEARGATVSFAGGWNPFGGGTGGIGVELANTGNARVDVVPTLRLTGPFGLRLGEQTLEPVQDLVPGGIAHRTAAFGGVPPLLLLWGDVEATVAAPGQPSVAAARGSAVGWAVPWSLLGLLVLVVGAAWGGLRWRRRRRAAVAADLAAYTQAQIERDRRRREAVQDGSAADAQAGTAPAQVASAQVASSGSVPIGTNAGERDS